MTTEEARAILAVGLLVADGRQLQAQYLSQMQETAGGPAAARILQMVLGG